MKHSLSTHERRLAAGCVPAQRAIFRADAGVLPMREFELKSKPDGTGGVKLNFTGYASVTEVGYTIADWLGDYTEIVRSGAFKTTLGQDPDVMFLLNHAGLAMARTRSGSLRLAEDGTGLHADADLDPRRTDINDLRVAVENKDIDEMSFAFRVTRQEWSPDYTQRDILEVDINGGDVSPVNKAANPATGGLVSLRSMVSPRVLHSVTTTLRAGDQLTPTQSATLMRVLAALAMADDHIDASLEELSELLGVCPCDTAGTPCCPCCPSSGTGTACCPCPDPGTPCPCVGSDTCCPCCPCTSPDTPCACCTGAATTCPCCPPTAPAAGMTPDMSKNSAAALEARRLLAVDLHDIDRCYTA